MCTLIVNHARNSPFEIDSIALKVAELRSIALDFFGAESGRWNNYELVINTTAAVQMSLKCLKCGDLFTNATDLDLHIDKMHQDRDVDNLIVEGLPQQPENVEVFSANGSPDDQWSFSSNSSGAGNNTSVQVYMFIFL